MVIQLNAQGLPLNLKVISAYTYYSNCAAPAYVLSQVCGMYISTSVEWI